MTLVYTASIMLDDGEDPFAQTLAETDHPDQAEALRWVEKQLPAAHVPAEYPPDSRLYGLVMPCHIETELLDGLRDQARQPDWAQHQYATLTASGRVEWSA